MKVLRSANGKGRVWIQAILISESAFESRGCSAMLSDRVLQGLEGNIRLVDSEVSWGGVGAAITA